MKLQHIASGVVIEDARMREHGSLCVERLVEK